MWWKKESEPLKAEVNKAEPQEEKIILERESHSPEDNGMLYYSLYDTIGFYDDERDFALKVDQYAALLEGCRLFFSFRTYVSKMPKRRWLLPGRKVKYGPPDKSGEAIKAYIKAHNPGWQWSERTVVQIRAKKPRPGIFLFVYSETADRKLIEMNTSHIIWWNEDMFRGYSKEQDLPKIEEISSEDELPEPAITFYEGTVSINPRYYPEEQLIERVRGLAAKYGVKAEIKL